MQWMTPRLWALVWALAYAAQADAKLVRSYNHVNSICSMWGRDHFKTFDGDVYQFPGMCEYNLASDCHSSFQDFSIHIKKRVDDKGQITVSRIMVTIKELPIQLTKQLIMVGGEIVSTPYHVSGVLIEENSAYTKLHYKLGLSVMWNREDAVMVELDPKYANRTCGLCGDYNGVPVYDEFISQGRKIGVIEFGNKQKIHNPNVDCEDPYEEEEDDEEQQQQQQQEVDSCLGPRSSCAQRLLSPAWASCASRLDPSPYISACAMDLCHPSPPANESSMCATLAEYSRQCSHARGTPPNWRTPTFCAMKCPYNMVYLESGSPCMNTCTHMETNSLCEEHNMDGCFCPEGTVFDDLSKSGCIPKEQCQCKHDRIYNNGEVLKMDTEECVCHEGRWSCKSHAGPGACAVEEGSHVTTYDGKTYNFHGNCFYVLSKDCVGSKFSILGELAPCSSQDWDTCLKRVVFRLLSDKRNDIVIQANGKVYHNAEVNLPYSTGDLTIFKPSSFHIILQTHFGLQLQIQLVPIMQLYISLDPSFRTKTCGLCGNYNMKLSDDLRSPQGMVEGTASSFANSWKAKTTCADSPDRLDDPCSISVDNENFAEHWCSLLKDKEAAFSKCHKAVNPDIYYKRCKYASCTCDRSEECLCAVVSSYVRACSTKGVFLPGWRDTVCKKYTDHCPATQTFSYQLQGCQRTCRSLGSDRQACSPDFLPVDGCSCPDGLYLDDSGVCVPMNKCPCQHNGDYIKPGKSINIKDEHCVCTNGKLHCRSWKRMPKGCPAPKVFFNCSAVDNNDAEMECVRTCMQRNVDCIAMECESGCRCPAGLLDDGRGHCVEEHNCPCHHDGHFYSSGAQIPLKCNNCTCNSGQWICSDKTCSSTCTIYGSGHYQTFDDQRFGFNGECSYVAVQDKCGDTPGSFNVITENVPCGTTGTTCSKSVRIVLGRTEVKLSDGAYEEIDLGGTGPPIKYTVRNVGLYLVIESVIGLTAFWDRRTTVRVILQPELMGKVCGLCGNFNGDGKDDFTTQGQLLVSDVLEFANSWKVSTCPDAEDNFDPCFKTPNRHTWAKMQCGIINSDTFKNCHPKVNPNPFFENCVKDSCACDNGGDCECFCTAVAAYAQACNEAGVCVAWRTPDICPVYCDYYNGPLNCTWHYSPCHTPCYKTCLNPEGICSAPIPNLEGCYPICPEDKPIFDEEKQICVEECEGCIINDHVYKPGEEVPTDKLCNSCICNQNGNLTCNRIPGCCVYNGTEYEENEVIYNVTDKMGMCYYAICINQTVIHESKPCIPTPSPPTPTQTTAPPEPTSTTGKTTVVSPTPGTPSTPSPTPTETTGPTTPGTSPTTPASGTPPLISTPTPTKPPGTPSTTEKTTVVTLTSGTWPTSIPSEPPMQSTTITTPRTEPTTCAPLCEWTEWFDVDTPHEIVDDDDETYENIKENGKTICDKPEDIRCRAVGYEDSTFEEFISVTSQDVQCNVSFGLLCEQHKQTRPPKKCYDYEIQVYCCTPCIHPPTPTTVSSEKTTVSSPPPSSTLTSTTGRPISTTTMYTPRTVSTTVEPTVTTAATSAGSSATETPVVTTMFTVRTESTLSPHFTSAPQEVFTTSTVTNPETSTTTGPPKPTPPIGTPEVSPTTGRTTVVSPTPETAPPPSPSTTTTTGPSTPTTPTTPIRTPEPTTPCVCTVNGTQYKPGDIIYDKHNIGSGICLTMICSAICEIQNSTAPCPTPTPVPTPTPTPTVTPDCPEWDKVQNETFWICNCTLARCIEDNIIEIIPYECPPLETLTCANGKKPVLVWDENLCCQKYACDCYCEGWGDPHYVTFDGLSYSHQGNCTYVLMEEIHPVFDFKIYVDNVKCDPREDVSCPRSVIISHKSDVITLKNNNLMGPAKLEAQKDGTTLKLPHAKNGIRVSGSGLKLIYEIPKLQIVVTFGIVGFTVNLPFQLFGNNTQGHCGTCNNNPHDDCRLPDGRLVDSCAVMADFWPAQDVYRPDCPVPDVVPTGMPLPLPSLRPCGEHPVCDLIKSDLFAECHPHISPDRFFDGCVFDSCHMVNPVVQCTSLQIYADACIQVDVCVNWRNHTTLCASDCPADKVYKPCGPAEQPTCDESLSGPGMNVVTEGCFCPEGTKLFSKDSSVCVDKCGCLDPDGKAREFDERFEHNCQDCVCEESTKAISCKSKQCPPPSITPCAQPGFVLVNTTDPSNPCCTLLTCRCDSSLCPTPNKRCSAGYEPVLMLTEGKCCQEIGCEPKPVCLHKQLEYKPGESVPVIPCQDCKCSEEKDPKSPWLEVKCHMMNCNEDCEPGYEYQTDDYDYDACCGECIQTHCALNVSGTVQLLEPGSTWFPHDSKCVAYSCTKVGDKFIAFKSDIQCPPFKESNCQPGTIQTLSNGCCKVCEQVSTGCQVETMLKTITYQGCQSQEEVEISHCEGSCNAFSKYSELEASMKHTCTCCRESRTSNRTVSLTCLDGSKVPHTYMHVEECQCSAKLCDDSSPWAPRRTGTGSFGRVTPRRRISTGGQSPIVKRSLSDRGG